MEKNEEKKDNKKLIIALVSALAGLIIIGFLVVGISYFNRQKLVKQADSLILIESYEDGIAIYDNLLSKKYSQELLKKRNLALELLEAEENLKKGLEAYEDDDLVKAVRYLSRVSKEDKKRYKRALEELELIEETVLSEIQKLIEAGELNAANEKADEYLKIDANNDKIKKAKKSIETKKTAMENKALEEAELAKAKQQEEEENARLRAEEEAASAKKQEESARKQEESARKQAEVQNVANNIIGTYKVIISEEANLRDAPTLNSGIIMVLNRGTEVYIYDTQIETADRIWCNVSAWQDGYEEYGWISYNTMNYAIQ